ncbi:MAG: ATP12 family chaperone protein [Rhodomicrobium sp.]
MKPSQPANRKRFYQSATVAEPKDGGYAVQLDGRPVKTPAGNPLAVPARALAQAIAGEWNAQGEAIVPASLPLTKLANTAIDGVADRKQEVADDILKYAATDLVCYRATHPTDLVAAQAAAWDPVLSWVEAKYGTPFLTASGIAHVTQPAASLEALGAAVAGLDAFKLAALHVITTLTGSALIALAHTGGDLDAAAAWAAAQTDENWQASRWGEDFEAEQRRKARLAEFEAASRFYKLS